MSGCGWCGCPKGQHTGKTSFRLEAQQPRFAEVRWTKSACSRFGCMCRKYEPAVRRQMPR